MQTTTIPAGSPELVAEDTPLARMLASTARHPDRAYFECSCGLTMIDDSADHAGFAEDVWDHEQYCPGADDAPPVRPIDEPVPWCVRCSSTNISEIHAAGMAPLLVTCWDCGHVFSLVAFRGLATRLGRTPAADVTEELHRLVGVVTPGLDPEELGLGEGSVWAELLEGDVS